MGNPPFHVNLDLGEFNLLQPIGFDKWKKGDDFSIIEGIWAEDFSKYSLVVPPQLRDSILLLQHTLCDRIGDLQRAKHEYECATEKMNKFLKG